MPPSIDPGIPRLGSTPAGWRRFRVRDLFRLVQRPVTLEPNREYELVVARRSRGGIESRGRLRGSQVKVKQQFRVEAGDFLISNRQISHGGCGIVPSSVDGAIVSGEYTVLHPKDELRLDFLRHYIHSRYFQQICFHSSVGVHVEKLVFRLATWLSWEVDLPPAEEQQRIAGVLDDYDSGIGAAEALIEAKLKAKRALLSQLFGSAPNEKARGELTALSSIGHFLKGRGIAKSDLIEEAGVPALRYADIYTRYGDVIYDLKSFVTAEAARRACSLEPGDIVFAASGETALEIGQAAAFVGSRPAVVGGDTVILRHHNQDPVFLAYALNTPHVVQQKVELGKGHSVVHIHAPDLAKIRTWLPPVERQRAISNVLVAADQEVELLVQEAELLRHQKRGLMRKLLTGEWRLAATQELEAAE
jgi:type I restriction enzyme S subunit